MSRMTEYIRWTIPGFHNEIDKVQKAEQEALPWHNNTEPIYIHINTEVPCYNFV